MFGSPEVSTRRASEIVREISYSSRARGRFFVLLITASMIASFGLIANSTAVIIGAMLVSPLMTPIFGAALGMLRGNPRLLGRALWSEALGVALAIGAAYLVGLPQLSFGSATPEMLARTQPNLLDLLVAIFAGFAGAYALLDERVSPALPGVAIATAIVPPLSTCGLCLSLGAWSGAGGALLLFLANFVSILIVALITFGAGGLARNRRYTLTRFVGSFGPTAAAFIVIAIILTNSLLRITRDRALDIAISRTLEEQLAEKHGADLDELVHRRTPQGVQVLATVRSQKTISPTWVTTIEEALEHSTSEQIDLVVRTIRSRDVSSRGSSLQAVRPDLNGVFLVANSNDFEAREMLVAQVVREYFELEPGFELTRVEYGVAPAGESVVVAYMNALRRLAQEEINELEDVLKDRLADASLHFFARINATPLRGRKGPILVGWTDTLSAGEQEASRLPRIEAAIRQAFATVSLGKPLRVHFNWADNHWKALVEVLSVDLLTPEQIQQIRQAMPSELSANVELLVRRRMDYIITEEGIADFDTLMETGIQQRSKSLRGLFQTTTLPRQQGESATPTESLASDN